MVLIHKVTMFETDLCSFVIKTLDSRVLICTGTTYLFEMSGIMAYITVTSLPKNPRVTREFLKNSPVRALLYICRVLLT